MLLVDNRTGSNELAGGLQALGLPVDLTTLEFGDVAFEGRGVAGEPLWVGIEFKQLTELAEAIKGRLPGHQLPGLVQNYERRYLLVEGEWETDKQGRLLHRSKLGAFAPILGMPPAIELQKRLLTYATRGGMQFIHAAKRKHTLSWLAALYRFWTDVDLDQHKSHIAIYNRDVDEALLKPKSQFVQTIATLPGVGREVAMAAEREFGNIRVACQALAQDWAALEVNGRKFGAKRAEKVVEAIRAN